VTLEEFERLLDQVAAQLTSEVRKTPFTESKPFENRVRQVLEEFGRPYGVTIDYDPHPYAFPDIAVGDFGVEVKFTKSDSWRSVANSVFETFRTQDIRDICVMYGKMGGTPGVRWARYADCVIHVRTSHVPRFELDIDATSSLFAKMGITYDEFSALPMEGKMRYIREYARGRLKEGERLWWLEDRPESDHSLPIEARLYTTLDADEQRRLRAEATLLCPQIFKSSRARDKYNDLALYLLTYHGVLAHQARDLFTAGSVSQHVELPADLPPATVNIARSTFDIQDEALRMEDALFVEYWGESVPQMFRIQRWLELADHYAVGWVPSEVLFK
jgi:hypothetical protein